MKRLGWVGRTSYKRAKRVRVDKSRTRRRDQRPPVPACLVVLVILASAAIVGLLFHLTETVR